LTSRQYQSTDGINPTTGKTERIRRDIARVAQKCPFIQRGRRGAWCRSWFHPHSIRRRRSSQRGHRWLPHAYCRLITVPTVTPYSIWGGELWSVYYTNCFQMFHESSWRVVFAGWNWRRLSAVDHLSLSVATGYSSRSFALTGQFFCCYPNSIPRHVAHVKEADHARVSAWPPRSGRRPPRDCCPGGRYR
jgi:hypothetical protein